MQPQHQRRPAKQPPLVDSFDILAMKRLKTKARHFLHRNYGLPYQKVAGKIAIRDYCRQIYPDLVRYRDWPSTLFRFCEREEKGLHGNDPNKS